MDISFWTRYNPKVAVDYTTKKYFGKYLYKLVVYAPAGRLIDSKGSIADGLEHRRVLNSNITSSWWSERRNRDLANADVLFLEKLRDIRHNKSNNFKLRVEEPRVQIYANSIEELENLVIDHFQLFPRTYIETIAGPETEEQASILNSGAIIRKKNNGYNYKVILRDGRYGSELKRSVWQYLDNLGEGQAHIPIGSLDMLHSPSNYMWNVYFFVNDPGITSFLSLMHPGLVSNIHELVVVSDK